MTNSALPRWLRRTIRLGTARDEIAEELHFHLAMEVERLQGEGVDAGEARRIAVESFGDVDAIEKECLRIRGGLVEDIACEVRSACRTLVMERRPALTAFVGLTAAMALFAIAFSVYQAAALQPLPYSSGSRVVRLWTSVPGIGTDQRWGMAKAQFQFIGRKSRSFSTMGIYRFETVTARPANAGKLSRLTAMTTSAGTLEVLGIRPLLGRGIAASDNLTETPEVALISYDTWENLYNRDSRVLDRTIDVDGSTLRIIGVLPSEVSFPEEMEGSNFSRPAVLVPMRLNPADAAENHHVFRALGLLAPGVDAVDAEADLRRLSSRLPEELPAAYSAAFMSKTGFTMDLVPLAEEARGDTPAVFILMLTAAALLMTMACAAAWDVQVREPAARRSPFASEMVLLVVCAGAAALVIASLVLRALPPLDDVFPRHVRGALTASAAGFSLLLGSVAAVLLAGVRGASARSWSQGTRAVPVVAQVLIAATLLMLAGTLARRVTELKETSPGFDAGNAVFTTLHLPLSEYRSHEAVTAFQGLLARKLESVEGLDAAGMTTSLPLSGYDGCSAVAVDSRSGSRCVPVYFVTPGYLEALGVSVRGREAHSVDEPAAVVSASFARRTWPGAEPIGKTLRLGPTTRPYRVVGVAGDVKSRGLDQPPRDDVYVPITPISGWNGWPPITDLTLVIRASEANPRLVAQRVQEVIASIDGTVETESVQTVAAIVAATMSRQVFLLWFISTTALIAVLLCAWSLRGSFRGSHEIVLRPNDGSRHVLVQ